VLQVVLLEPIEFIHPLEVHEHLFHKAVINRIVLRKVVAALQFPEDPETTASEFLTLLGKHGLMEFLPEDTFAKQDDLCADK